MGGKFDVPGQERGDAGAEQKGKAISKRIRAAWQAAKERGTKLDGRYVYAELLRKDHREWPADTLTKACGGRTKLFGTSLEQFTVGYRA